ncbi:UDP-glucuronate decarboxylase [Breznakia sp. PF5-3]|uniref:NAD-dependent epimerase/dehydratase family protein n=1 Tax=unclassified Breznakia TaxID=2623764 RepID=UPI0024064D65|nr:MULTISPECIES: NAD-dependent epimerase/dehydratase family protein [unclassified Breznakia]MDF9824678.1 UDP-glucuronate decarboxylase [Breznakia sp. PM6-1]MDF9835341.1 UDP-glucuronate decarboxylase [Breznakia sp. PF5-3]MDF9836940.1 UDP-glucuronate decarboxylase [Breznakia sp. PFB2-8]MDF9859576.1 UDP-glucuronate decarboxylase [Breznakia sp. PH5-24]
MKYSDSYIKMDMQKIYCDDYVSKIESKSTILVTGCNGMIATYLIYFFLFLNDEHKKNIHVIGMTRSPNKTMKKYQDIIDRKDFTIIEHDVNNVFDIDIDIDYIFHFASNADPKNILERPVDIIRANTLGLMNVLEYAKEKKIKKIIFPSTREVYGKMSENYEEVHEYDLGVLNQLETRACYPESKKMAECILNSYYLQYQVPYAIFRIAHSYGPGMPIEKDGRIMSDLVGNVVRGEDILLNSDGSAIRGFIYLTDMISGMLYGTFIGLDAEVYNLANEKENLSILELAKMLVSLQPNKELKVTYKKISEKEKEGYTKFKRVRLNMNKLEKLGWSPQVSLIDGLKTTIKSYES